jgi:hypothetical protein
MQGGEEVDRRKNPGPTAMVDPPPVAMSKVNVDGAVAKSTNRGAAAVICCSPDGTYMGASAVVFEGMTNPSCLEALACRESLADEGMTLGSSILAYLVFGPGRASSEGMARPINMIDWRGPGVRLGV